MNQRLAISAISRLSFVDCLLSVTLCISLTACAGVVQKSTRTERVTTAKPSEPEELAARITVDSWYRNAPLQLFEHVVPLEQRMVIQLPLEKQNAAQALLAESSFRALSADDIASLGISLRSPALDSQFYLVRALYLNAGTGGFSVYRKGTQIRVSHGSLGHNSVPMKRAALIVELTEPPTDVFVTCSMAE